MSKELIELSNALAQATDRAAASVVAVHTETTRLFQRNRVAFRSDRHVRTRTAPR